MKNFFLAVLIIGAVGYYFDISPTDFLPTVQNTKFDSPRAIQAGTSGQTARTAPVATSVATPVPAHTPDGSLSNRWKP